MTYRAPLKDMLFVMKELAGIEAVAALPGYEDAGLETAAAVLEECARFNEEVVVRAAAESLPPDNRAGRADDPHCRYSP